MEGPQHKKKSSILAHQLKQKINSEFEQGEDPKLNKFQTNKDQEIDQLQQVLESNTDPGIFHFNANSADQLDNGLPVHYTEIASEKSQSISHNSRPEQRAGGMGRTKQHQNMVSQKKLAQISSNDYNNKDSAQESGNVSQRGSQSSDQMTPGKMGFHFENKRPKERPNYQIKTQKHLNKAINKHKFTNNHRRIPSKKGEIITASKQPKYNKTIQHGQAEVRTIEQIQNWYNDRKTSISPVEVQGSVEYQNQMLEHYNQHMKRLEEQQQFLREMGKPQDHNHLYTGGKMLNNAHAQLPNMPRSLGPMINVHQHFNQPNITNFNNNQYYISPESSRNIRIKSDLRNNQPFKRESAKDSRPTKQDIQAKFQKKQIIQNVSSSQLVNQKSENQTVDIRTNGNLPKINYQRPDSKQSNQNNLTVAEMHLSQDPNNKFKTSTRDIQSIDSAIVNQAINLNNQHSQSPSNIYRNYKNPMKNRRFRLERIQKAYKVNPERLSAKGIISNQSYDPSMYFNVKTGKHRGNQSIKTFLPVNIDQIQREDLQDELFLAKSQLNNANLELTKVKTRNAIMHEHMRNKEKFIDELLKQMGSNMSTQGSPGKRQNAELSGYISADGSAERIINQGPYSVMKLKKKCQTYKEMLAFKTAENEELMRNVKNLKVIELQKQLKLQKKTVDRLRQIAQIVNIETEAQGLTRVQTPGSIKKSSRLITLGQESLHNQIVDQYKSGHEQDKNPFPVPGQEDESGKIQAIQIRLQVSLTENQRQQVENGQKDFLIEQLNKKIQETTQKLNSSKQRDASESRQTEEKKGKQGERDEAVKDGLKAEIFNLKEEKVKLEKRLKEEQKRSETLKKSIEQLQNQGKESTTGQKALVKIVKDQERTKSDLEGSKKQVASLNQQNQSLRAQVSSEKVAYELNQQKMEEDNKNKISDLKKQSETHYANCTKKTEEMKVLQTQITEQNGQIPKLKEQIQILEDKLSKSEKESQVLQESLNKNQMAIVQSQSSIRTNDHNNSSSQLQVPLTQQRAFTVKKKDNQDDDYQLKQESDRKMTIVSESIATNSQMKEEIERIDNHINNARESDFDERSDLQFSVMQSQVPGITTSEIGSIMPFIAYQSPSILGAKPVQREVIEEEVENEDYQQEKSANQSENEKKSKEGPRKNPALRPGISNSLILNPASKLSIPKTAQQQQANLILTQLDQIPGESQVTIFDPTPQETQKGSVREVKFVEFQDESVQTGFERLGRLLQIKRLALDQIEQVVLEDKFTTNQSVKIKELKQIWKEKINMEDSQALEFARFLIEEKDEDLPEVTTIELELNRQINSQYIPVRLMSMFTIYPTVYKEQDDQATKESFLKLPKKTQQNLVKDINEQEEAIIPFSVFKQLLDKQKPHISQLTEVEIDCAHVILCRGTSSVDNLSVAELAERTIGFDTQNIALIFPGVDPDSESDEYSEIEENQELQQSEKFPSEKEASEHISGTTPHAREELAEGKEESNKSKKVKMDSELMRKESINSRNMSVKQSANQGEIENQDKVNNFTFKQQSQEPLEKEGIKSPESREVEDEFQQQKSYELPVPESSRSQQNLLDIGFAKPEDKEAEKDNNQNYQTANFTSGQIQEQEDSQIGQLPFEGDQFKIESEKHAPSENASQKSEKLASDQAISEKFISEKPKSERVISEKKASEKFASEKPASVKIDSEKASSTKSVIDNDISKKAVSERAISEKNSSVKAISEKKSSVKEISDKKSSVQAMSEKQQSVKATSNKLISEEGEEHKAVSEKAISEKPISEKAISEKQMSVKLSEHYKSIKSSQKQASLKKESEKPKSEKSSVKPQSEISKKETSQKEEEAAKSENKEQSLKDDYSEQDKKSEKKDESQKASELASQKSKKVSEKADNESEKELSDHYSDASLNEVKDYEKEENKDDSSDNQGNQVLDLEKENEKQEESKQEDERGQKDQEEEEEQKQVSPNEATELMILKILRQRIEEDGLEAKFTEEKKENLAKSTASSFIRVAEVIKRESPDLVDSCLDIFKDIIYSEVKVKEIAKTEHQTSHKKSKESLSVEKEEMYILIPLDFAEKLDLILEKDGQPKLSSAQKTCNNLILCSNKRNGLISYDQVQQILATQGIRDVKTPDKGSNLNYEQLDLRSIRILNRMIHWLGSSNIGFNEFMKDLIQIQEVKTKSGNLKVEIFHAKKFFAKLHTLGLKKNGNQHNNICTFMCIDPKYKNYLMLKKLKRVIIDFNQSRYFQSVGLKKNKLPAEDETQFDYYDEEDPRTGSRHSKIRPIGSRASSFRPRMTQKDIEKSIHDALNSPSRSKAEDFEYYDEEDESRSPSRKSGQKPKLDDLEVNSATNKRNRDSALFDNKKSLGGTMSEMIKSPQNKVPTGQVALKSPQIKKETIVDQKETPGDKQEEEKYEYYDEEDDGGK